MIFTHPTMRLKGVKALRRDETFEPYATEERKKYTLSMRLVDL